MLDLILFLAVCVSTCLSRPTGDASHNNFDQVGFSTLNGGTTGGEGGTTTTVSSLAALMTAVTDDSPKVVYVDGNFEPTERIKLGNNTSLIGVGAGADINGYGIQIANKSNIIIRNLGIHSVVDNDAISATFSHNIWIDHCEFWSERSHGFDYYDGLVDITKGSDYVTVSWSYFHTHWKASLVGGDPEAIAKEGSNYHVTYHHNYWRDISTRTPAIRFGQAHVFNSFYHNITAQGIHPRSYAQCLIEGNVFVDVKEPISTYGKVIPEDSPNSSPEGDYEADGFANERDNDFSKNNGPTNITRVGTFTDPPYSYKHVWTPLKRVEHVVLSGVGLGKI